MNLEELRETASHNPFVIFPEKRPKGSSQKELVPGQYVKSEIEDEVSGLVRNEEGVWECESTFIGDDGLPHTAHLIASLGGNDIREFSKRIACIWKEGSI